METACSFGDGVVVLYSCESRVFILDMINIDQFVLKANVV